MPFKSKAQMKKFGEMVKEGKITKEEFDKWAKDTPKEENLPDRVGKKEIKSIKDLKEIAKVKKY